MLYIEVNLEGFPRIGSKILCPLLGGVHYKCGDHYREV